MDKFEASNGITITMGPDGEGKVYLVGRRAHGDEGQYLDTHATGGPEGIDALREFFQHERDEELGRWRWPEDADYVVYPRHQDVVLVLHEGDGSGCLWARERAELLRDDTLFRLAARAYFEAHPERKPWHDAKHGEIWVMTVGVGPEMVTYVDRETNDFPRFIDPTDDMSYGPKSGFTDGRRIWPESD